MVKKKILALGSVAALALTSLVGLAPANAAVGINLQPSVGTEFTMIEGETFTLSSFGNVEFPQANGTQLRVKVTNDGAASFDTFEINGTALDADYATTVGNSILFAGVSPASSQPAAVPVVEGTQAVIGTADNATAVMGLGASGASFDATDAVTAMTSPFTFSFENATVAADAPEKLEVQVWADVNNNGAIDAGEVTSPMVTVTFINAADVVPTMVSTAFAGDQAFTVTTTFGAVNEAQLVAANTGLKILNNAGTPATVDAGQLGGLYTGLTLNTAKTAFTQVVDNQPTQNGTGVDLAVTGTSSQFKITTLYKTSGAPAVTDTVGTTANIATLVVSSRTLNTTNSYGEAVGSANAVFTTSASNQTASVRKNSEWNVRLKARDGSTPAAAVVGLGTSAAVSTSVSLSATKTLTVNGTVYTTDASLALLELAGATDASGYSTVTLKTTGMAANDTVTVIWTTQGQTDQVVSTLATAGFTAAFAEGSEAADDGYDRTIAIGGTTTVKYLVADQWGVAPADSAYTVTITRAASGAARTTAASYALSVPVVGGVATATIVDNGAGAGADTITATLVGAIASGTDAFTLSYATAAAAAVTGLVLADNQGTDDSPVQANSVAITAWNGYQSASVAAPTLNANNIDNGATTWVASDILLTLSGVATVASGAGVEGAQVTLAAAGISFKFTDGASGVIVTRDSITVPTSAGGAYSVNAYADGKGGDVVITATIGSISKSTTIRFAGNTAVGSFTVVTPANSMPGKVADVVVTAVDSYGDAISGATVALSSTGAGYLLNTSGTTVADGTFSTKLLLGTNESGTATIKVTMTVAGVSTTQTNTIVIGAAVADATSLPAGAVVNVGTFNGKIVVYAKGLKGSTITWKIAGKWVKAEVTLDFQRFDRPTAALGLDVMVDIYMAGNKTPVFSTTVTTK
jgi:hypothetical protein